MATTSFGPTSLTRGERYQGSFRDTRVYDLVALLASKRITGVLSVPTEAGLNRLFMRKGRPVALRLAEPYCPLGQLLLELGLIDGATFLRATKIIEEEKRLPGEVYLKLGAISGIVQFEVLQIQAQRKMCRFLESCVDAFEFSRSPRALAGLTETSIPVDMVILLALDRFFAPDDREAYLQSLVGRELRARSGAAAVLESLGVSIAERRLVSLLQTWCGASDLDQEGSPPRSERALILKLLDLLGLLQRRAERDLAEEENDRAPPTVEDASAVFGERTLIDVEPHPGAESPPTDVSSGTLVDPSPQLATDFDAQTAEEIVATDTRAEATEVVGEREPTERIETLVDASPQAQPGQAPSSWDDATTSRLEVRRAADQKTAILRRRGRRRRHRGDG